MMMTMMMVVMTLMAMKTMTVMTMIATKTITMTTNNNKTRILKTLLVIR